MPKGHGLDPAIVAREARAIELANAGLSYDEIAAEFGVTKGTAWKLVQRALRRTLINAGAEEYRQRQLDDIAEMKGNLRSRANGQPEVEGGTPPTPEQQDRAVLSMVRLLDREARLTGIDAPVEVVLTESPEDRAARVAQRLREFRAERAVEASSHEVNGNGKEPHD